ncbi:carbohydrate ABC transporter substrate-binding protein (CUT1 family) [Prauserella shujinwangii]|uniref:Carbohydrate ABC transporter substrate-binding protein (CUT1 family) n=1 Tax=Prauserella shujinwangii TaxID=1453103 RepID=A0A2T0M3S5_9PSEU|nr:ABC transporter substrate-binding protein [Prauserella shujinwangii]PRX51393.1 carbohydrate ABC transporter substrate-binding protein (CUT1 family) [Prauserella shujinwangii]
MTRSLLAAGAAAALMLTGSACGLGSTGTGSEGSVSRVPELAPDQEVSIVFESYNFGQAGAWTDTFNELIAAFEKEHPNITVTAQKPQGNSANPATDTISSLQSQLTAGSPPDVVQLGFSDLDFTINELKALPLDDLVGRDAVQANFDGARHPYAPSARTLGDWEGKTYGVPFVFSTPMLYVNKKLFTEAGLDPEQPPTTWAEVRDAAQAIDRRTGKDGVYVDCLTKTAKDWCFQALVRSHGGTVISDDRTRLTFAEKPSIDVVRFMRDMVREGIMPNRTQTQAVESFARGDLGMILESSAIQGMFLQGAGDAWELGAAAMPSFEGKQAVPTNSGAALFVFAQDPAKQRAAWELIKFLTSERAYTTIATKIGYLPLRTGLVEDPGGLESWAADNPYLAPNLAQLEHLEPWVSMPGPSYLQIRDGMMQAVENAVFQGAGPAEALRSAQQEASALLPGGER